MRIISGKYKGRRLQVPSNMTARPTTDFAKEGLFDFLNNIVDFEQVTVLDLFAGTGSISYEFISRSSPKVVAVENNKIHVNFILQTIKKLDISNLTLLRTDVFHFLKNYNSSFDLIFADPPYDLIDLAQIADKVLDANILNTDGLFVLEHSARYDFSKHQSFKNHRKYGNVNFSVFE
ncbi:MAG: 16S rRNA (guanine(966)-N(2))-methyltransferase RsmD [Paludibacter sp.]|nr:16S rRNA (guanine(966)-N(2))-methyltransferase RsmD [Paludibacter sp.]